MVFVARRGVCLFAAARSRICPAIMRFKKWPFGLQSFVPPIARGKILPAIKPVSRDCNVSCETLFITRPFKSAHTVSDYNKQRPKCASGRAITFFSCSAWPFFKVACVKNCEPLFIYKLLLKPSSKLHSHGS